MAWNRPSGKSEPIERMTKSFGGKGFRNPLHNHPILISSTVIGIATFCWLVFSSGSTDAVIQGRQDPAKPINATTPARQVATNKANVVSTSVKPVDLPRVKVVKAITNDDGAVVEDFLDEEGKLRRVVRPPRQVWHNAADQLIAMTLAIEPGFEAAPLPRGVTDEEFRRALKTEIVIYNDDTPETRDIKMRVREARKDILEMMDKQGRGFEEILQEYHSEMNANTKAYQDALKGLIEVKKNGTPEDVRKYRTVMNAALQQVGAKELPYDDEISARHRRGKTRKGK